MVKYVVRLHPEEREQLLALVNTGRAAAAKLLHARIVLKADVSAEGRRWTDAEIAEALDTSAATVHRVRQAFVEWGLETALARKPPTGRALRARCPKASAPMGCVELATSGRRKLLCSTC